MASKLTKKQARMKAVGRSPNWLKTVAIAKPHRNAPIRGSFGAASSVVSIDPKTGQPREGSA